MCRLAFILLFLFSLNAAAADETNELQRLHSAVNMLNQEQQTIYQQFQMVQELIRGSFQLPYSTQIQPMQTMGEVPNYADVIAAQKNAARRGEELYVQANRLLARYGEIEEEKKPLQQRILKLISNGK
ncbi:hypothetical protein SKTS_23690 [Sulfurimicrobium lacus]|uniref:DUF4168 domain-containing protein n=1 Tax=Sulfurimicrobium lacus TaxID=2715678 RepID=A0A6F8VCB5_9PROT|nr:hypothetical protein [Sulfurimicrobium lacus]BCB27483.1 hypothetical protein SKTS_23690 [Sulfurimicrobium lacus]